jgi:hypothetical protein
MRLSRQVALLSVSPPGGATVSFVYSMVATEDREPLDDKAYQEWFWTIYKVPPVGFRWIDCEQIEVILPREVEFAYAAGAVSYDEYLEGWRARGSPRVVTKVIDRAKLDDANGRWLWITTAGG